MATEYSRALVLGGGGVTGVAWETGLLFGLEKLGISLRSADLLVGTSAGSVVAAQVAGPTSLQKLYEAQLAGFVKEMPSKLGIIGLVRLIASAFTKDEQRSLAKVGAKALAAKTVSEPARRAVIEQRLPVHEWPSTPIKIPAIDAQTGEFKVFDKSSGVSLVDAVGASCAVPTVFPCVTIGDRRYFDGGIRSVANVDLAAGAERIVVIAPGTRSLRRGMSPAEQLAALRVTGTVVSPDAEARAQMGRNALDPEFRAPSAKAGFAQAERVAEAVAAVWG